MCFYMQFCSLLLESNWRDDNHYHKLIVNIEKLVLRSQSSEPLNMHLLIYPTISVEPIVSLQSVSSIIASNQIEYFLSNIDFVMYFK